jgi:hypothetical protein
MERRSADRIIKLWKKSVTYGKRLGCGKSAGPRTAGNRGKIQRDHRDFFRVTRWRYVCYNGLDDVLISPIGSQREMMETRQITLKLPLFEYSL